MPPAAEMRGQFIMEALPILEHPPTPIIMETATAAPMARATTPAEGIRATPAIHAEATRVAVPPAAGISN